jgi:hypothetical protein
MDVDVEVRGSRRRIRRRGIGSEEVVRPVEVGGW